MTFSVSDNTSLASTGMQSLNNNLYLKKYFIIKSIAMLLQLTDTVVSCRCDSEILCGSNCWLSCGCTSRCSAGFRSVHKRSFCFNWDLLEDRGWVEVLGVLCPPWCVCVYVWEVKGQLSVPFHVRLCRVVGVVVTWRKEDREQEAFLCFLLLFFALF